MDGETKIQIKFKPHPKQKEVLECSKRYIVCVVGRRGGKTTIAMRLLLDRWRKHKELVGKPAKYWYVAPTLDQARNIVWNEDMLFKFFPKEVIKSRRESDFLVELEDGSTIQLKSCDDYSRVSRLKGSGLDGVIIDEYDSMPSAVWQEALRPALADKEGWAVFIGTPDAGFGNLYHLYMLENTDDDWQSFNWTIFDNPKIKPAEKEGIRRAHDAGAISEADWKIQYLGKFSKHSGAIYPQFDIKKHVYMSDRQVPRDSEIYLGLDYGVNDPYVCLWVAVDNTNTFWIYREHYVRDMEPSWHEEEIRRKNGRDPVKGAFMDPSAKGIMMDLRKSGFPFNGLRDPFKLSEPKSSRILNGIRRIQAKLADDPILRRPTLYVHKSCANTINEFQMYAWKSKDGADQDIAGQEDNHAMDALRYVIYGATPARKQSGSIGMVVRKNPLDNL
jgi:hypothetical protein